MLHNRNKIPIDLTFNVNFRYKKRLKNEFGHIFPNREN